MEKTINANASVKIPENIKGVKNITYGTLEHVTYKDGNYLGSISGDSVIICDEVIEVKKAVPMKTILTKIFQQIFSEKR